jgi:hypothetical protein
MGIEISRASERDFRRGRAMANYTSLNPLLINVTSASAPQSFRDHIGPMLVALWADEYAEHSDDCELLETSQGGFSYLFDIFNERLVAAWGISRGKNTALRDGIASRMRGHPLSNGGRYHRGHTISHILGGATDINLVPQLGKINSGAFRALEGLAASHPGALYFTYWLYDRGKSQTPVAVEQGVLCPEATACMLRLETFRN